MLPKSSEVRFEVINHCNYNCKICMKGKLSRQMSGMGYSLFKFLLGKIIEETDQYKTLTFAGIGEPLLDPSLVTKVRYASEQGLKPLLVTNGSQLHVDKFLELQDSGLYSVRISFHGATPEGYSNLHGVSQEYFHIVRKMINDLLKFKNRSTKVLLTCVFVPGVNEATAEEWIKLWDIKPDLMEIWRPHNWSDGLSFRKIQGARRKSCGRILDGPLQIQVDGTINACCFDWDGKLLFGDLKTHRLKEIFSSMEYDKIAWRHKIGDFKDSNLVCENCDQRNLNKKEACIYSTKFDLNKRGDLTSTAYEEVI